MARSARSAASSTSSRSGEPITARRCQWAPARAEDRDCLGAVDALELTSDDSRRVVDRSHDLAKGCEQRVLDIGMDEARGPTFWLVTIPACSARPTSRCTVGMLDPAHSTSSVRLYDFVGSANRRQESALRLGAQNRS